MTKSGRHNVIPPKNGFFSCPGSAWVRRGSEALPLVPIRPQAEPGAEAVRCFFMVNGAPQAHDNSHESLS